MQSACGPADAAEEMTWRGGGQMPGPSLTPAANEGSGKPKHHIKGTSRWPQALRTHVSSAVPGQRAEWLHTGEKNAGNDEPHNMRPCLCWHWCGEGSSPEAGEDPCYVVRPGRSMALSEAAPGRLGEHPAREQIPGQLTQWGHAPWR